MSSPSKPNYFGPERAARHKAPINRRWKFAAVFGNLLLGGAEIVTGSSSSLSLTADGVHNTGDALTYSWQSDDLLRDDLNHHRLEKRRKLTYTLIALSSAAVAVRAGYDLDTGTDHTGSTFGMYVAGASVSFNGLLYGSLRRKTKLEHSLLDEPKVCGDESDLRKHLLKLDIPSALLALGGVTAQRHGFENTEQFAAIASGALGVITFLPTKHNLSHQHSF